MDTMNKEATTSNFLTKINVKYNKKQYYEDILCQVSVKKDNGIKTNKHLREHESK